MANNNLIFPSPAGDKFRTEYLWNDDKTDLVKVRDVDIQKEINEAAKGCTIQEQIARLGMGDMSVLQEGEPIYADVSDLPETQGEAIQQARLLGGKVAQVQNRKEETQKEETQKSEIEVLKEKLAAVEAQIKGEAK